MGLPRHADGDAPEQRYSALSIDCPSKFYVPQLVEISDSIRRGAVSLQHGWADADVNQLTSDTEFDPLNGMPRLSGFPVTVVPVDDDASRGSPARRRRG